MAGPCSPCGSCLLAACHLGHSSGPEQPTPAVVLRTVHKWDPGLPTCHVGKTVFTPSWSPTHGRERWRPVTPWKDGAWAGKRRILPQLGRGPLSGQESKAQEELKQLATSGEIRPRPQRGEGQGLAESSAGGRRSVYWNPAGWRQRRRYQTRASELRVCEVALSQPLGSSEPQFLPTYPLAGGRTQRHDVSECL